MKCSECGYHWQEEGEQFPCCHFNGPEGWAPCEYEEEPEEEEEVEDRYTYEDLGWGWY